MRCSGRCTAWAGAPTASPTISARCSTKPAGYVKVIIAAALAGFVLSAPLRYVGRRLWTSRLQRSSAAALLAAYATALAWRVLVNLAYATFMADDPHMEEMTPLRTTSAAP